MPGTFGSGTFGGGWTPTYTGPTPRFRSRHVHQTLIAFVKSGLTTRGWVTAPINFGTTPVTFIEYMPDEVQPGVPVAPNTVAISLGDEPEDLDEELGAGLQSCEYTLFLDIYGANAAVAISIASDLKALLKNAIIPLRDYTSSASGVATDNVIEFDFVIIERPDLTTTGPDKRHWRVVKATARLHFVE